MRTLLRAAFVLSTFFVLLLTVFHVPSYDSVPALTVCDTLCWQGLQVQSTRRDQALEVMNRLTGSAPRFAICYDRQAGTCELYRWESSESSAVVEIGQGKLTMLTFDQPNVTLGDLLLALYHLDQPLEDYLITAGRDSLDLQLTFAASSLTLELSVTCPTTYLSLLRTPIVFMGIDAPAPMPSEQRAVPFRLVRHDFYRMCERR